MRNQKVKYLVIIGILLLFAVGMITVANTDLIYASQLSEVKVEKELGIIEDVELPEVYRELAKSINAENGIYIDEEDITIEEEPTVINTETVKPYDEETIEVLTNTLYGEARGIKGDHKKAAVIWCILNRYDNGNYGKTIIDVATAPNQFCGYVKDRVYNDLNSYNHCREIVIDVLDRYYTDEQIGRTLPKDYLYFVAHNGDNVFTQKWQGTDYWDWSLGSPYND